MKKIIIMTIMTILLISGELSYAAFPTTFSTLTGNQPLSLLDNMFNVVGSMGQIMCTASGTNTVILSPVVNMPTVSSYNNYQAFGFVAANTSTGSVTVSVSSVSTLPLYLPDGVTQASGGTLVAGAYYLIVYNSALNSGGGGFQMITSIASSSASHFNATGTGTTIQYQIQGVGGLWEDTTNENTVVGYTAAPSTISQVGGGGAGTQNTAFGFQALNSNTTGAFNIAIGVSSLTDNTTGTSNTAIGGGSLGANTIGPNNVAIGNDALGGNTTGADNVAIGILSGNSGVPNTVGSQNTFVGFEAQANANNYSNGMALGNSAILTASNRIVLGNSSINSIYAQVTSITGISDRRRKKDIDLSDLGLDFISSLEPVHYRYSNGDETLRYGFIAQDVESALPENIRPLVNNNGLALIQHDKDDVYHMSYDELLAPMVKAIQQLHYENEYLQGEIEALRAEKNGR